MLIFSILFFNFRRGPNPDKTCQDHSEKSLFSELRLFSENLVKREKVHFFKCVFEAVLVVFMTCTIYPKFFSLKICIRKCILGKFSNLENFDPNFINFNQFLEPNLTNLRHVDFFKSQLDGKSIKSSIIHAMSPVFHLRFD